MPRFVFHYYTLTDEITQNWDALPQPVGTMPAMLPLLSNWLQIRESALALLILRLISSLPSKVCKWAICEKKNKVKGIHFSLSSNILLQGNAIVVSLNRNRKIWPSIPSSITTALVSVCAILSLVLSVQYLFQIRVKKMSFTARE